MADSKRLSRQLVSSIRHPPSAIRHPQMLITFSGLDGAGKSTLVEWLRGRLEGRDRRVSVYHMYYDVGLFACGRVLLDKVRGGRTTAKGAGRAWGRDGRRLAGAARLGRAVAWNKTLRLCLYPLDLLIFLGCRLYVEKLRRRVLIMDRYFYDTLVDVGGGRRDFGARLLSRLTPTPHVPVLLDVSAEEAFARKGEHTLDYLERRRRLYQQLFSTRPRAVVLANCGDPEAARRALEKVVLERLDA